jgi:hypothetical protein
MHYNSQEQGPVNGVLTNEFSACKKVICIPKHRRMSVVELNYLYSSLSGISPLPEHCSKTSVSEDTLEMPVTSSPTVL